MLDNEVGALIWCQEGEQISSELIAQLKEENIKVYSNVECELGSTVYTDKNTAAMTCCHANKYMLVIECDTLLQTDSVRKHVNIFNTKPYVSLVYGDYQIKYGDITWYQVNKSFDVSSLAIPPFLMLRADMFVATGGFDMRAYPLENVDIYTRMVQQRAAYHFPELSLTMFAKPQAYSTEQLQAAQSYIRSKNGNS